MKNVPTGDGELLIWTMKDGSRVAWVVTSAGTDEGTTCLSIAVGQAE